MENEPAPADDLQFDRAEYDAETAAGTLDCGRCKQPIAGTYYEVNGNVICEQCHRNAEAFRTGGNAVQRFAMATVCGALAAALGAGIYYGISALTGYEFGLIAILVGFMVGFAVSFGARGRGGWVYQLLAVGLTYAAIVSTYVPQVAEELRNLPAEPPAQQDASVPGSALPADDELYSPAAEPAIAETSETSAIAEGELGLEEIPVFFWAVVVVLAFVAPFLAGFQNFLGLLIIGFGLWQAGKINRKQPHEVAGPFEVGAAPGDA